MDARARLHEIVATILGIPRDRVTDDLSSEAVDTWDSLNHINLIGALEQEFGVRFPAANLGDSMSIPKLTALLAERGVQV